MRGRTNITPRKEPIINGQLISATVESGNTISVGDFVEYKVDYAETETTDYNVTKQEELEVANYKILLITKNSQSYLELWKKSTQERVDSIVINEERSYSYMDVVDDTHLIVYSPSSTFYYIGISNDSFDIIQTLTYGTSPNPTAICVLDSSHFGAFVKESGSSNYNMKVYVFSFDDTAITYQTYKSFALGYSNKPYASYVKKVAPGKIMLFGLTNTGSYYEAVYLISFDSSYNFSSDSYISVYTATERLKVNDTMFAFLVGRSLSLIKYDSANDAISNYLLLDLSTIFGTFNTNNGRVNISLLNENQIAIYGCLNASITTSKRECVILTYDDTQDTYSVSEKVEVSNRVQFLEMKFTISDLDDAKLFSNASSIRMKIQDDTFEHLPDTNYVKSYNGGKAIGFAKTAGNAGQTVNIYTPTLQ